jgi:hypothetical protein
MTNYISDSPIISSSSFTTPRSCYFCGKDLTNSVRVLTIEDNNQAKKSARKIEKETHEVCIDCLNGTTVRNQTIKNKGE